VEGCEKIKKKRVGGEGGGWGGGGENLGKIKSFRRY